MKDNFSPSYRYERCKCDTIVWLPIYFDEEAPSPSYEVGGAGGSCDELMVAGVLAE